MWSWLFASSQVSKWSIVNIGRPFYCTHASHVAAYVFCLAGCFFSLIPRPYICLYVMICKYVLDFFVGFLSHPSLHTFCTFHSLRRGHFLCDPFPSPMLASPPPCHPSPLLPPELPWFVCGSWSDYNSVIYKVAVTFWLSVLSALLWGILTNRIAALVSGRGLRVSFAFWRHDWL